MKVKTLLTHEVLPTKWQNLVPRQTVSVYYFHRKPRAQYVITQVP